MTEADAHMIRNVGSRASDIRLQVLLKEQEMLYGQIERELIEGEPLFLWQQAKLISHQPHLVEQEQGRRDLQDETLVHYVEDFRSSPSNSSVNTVTTASILYQLFFHYCYLLLGTKNY